MAGGMSMPLAGVADGEGERAWAVTEVTWDVGAMNGIDVKMPPVRVAVGLGMMGRGATAAADEAVAVVMGVGETTRACSDASVICASGTLIDGLV